MQNMVKIDRQNSIAMLNLRCFLFSATNLPLHKFSNGKLYPFTETDTDLLDRIWKHMAVGLSIVFPYQQVELLFMTLHYEGPQRFPKILLVLMRANFTHILHVRARACNILYQIWIWRCFAKRNESEAVLHRENTSKAIQVATKKVSSLFLENQNRV